MGPYVLAVLGSFVIVAGLVYAMRSNSHTTDLGADRAAERRKLLGVLKAENTQVLTSYSWQHEGKQIVRLPIEQAKAVALAAAAKAPGGLRAEVVGRVEKFNKPVSFE